MAEIAELKEEKKNLKIRIENLNNRLLEANNSISMLKDQMGNIDQYLRVNNIEIVGLPEVNDVKVEVRIRSRGFKRTESTETDFTEGDWYLPCASDPKGRIVRKCTYVVSLAGRQK